MMSGDPVAYAPHLRKEPLANVPAKPVIVQFGKGDRNIPNPTETALVRAGDLADRVTFYRHDLAFAADPTLDGNPHQFLVRVVGNPGERRIALGYQSQIAAFFASDGNAVIHPEPVRFFETPIRGALPEDVDFITVGAAPPVRVESVVVNDGSAQRSMVNSLTITFSGVVTLYSGAFVLQGHNGSVVGLNVDASVLDGRTVAVLTFSGSDIIGGSLADGNYTLAIRADWIRDANGQELDGDGDGISDGDRTETFFRLFGDSDGDRDVDWQDLGRFLSAFGRRAGDANYLAYFDVNGDDRVGLVDLVAFARRLGTHLNP
jgi:hypothetical protein